MGSIRHTLVAHDAFLCEQVGIGGELLTTYGYSAVSGSKSFTCTNYYDNTEVTIPLDETLSVMDNAKRYYERYSKLKRTGEALAGHIDESRAELTHLESVRESLGRWLSLSAHNTIHQRCEPPLPSGHWVVCRD